MVTIQVELDIEEDQILQAFMFGYTYKTKKDGLKALVKESKNLPKIKALFETKDSFESIEKKSKDFVGCLSVNRIPS